MSDIDDEFRSWYARNHPFDWWAKDRKGEPLPPWDRILVWDLTKRAFEAGAALSQAKP